jgi:DNA polymerase III subunit delta
VTAMRLAAFEGFLRRPDDRVRVIVFYGSDLEGAREWARRTVKKLAGAVDDVFRVVKLDDADIAADPGRLADEVGSLSMFGGMRVVHVTNGDAALAKALGPILAESVPGNMIVVEAGNQARGSPLRSLVEAADGAIGVAIYEPSAEDMAGLARSTLAAAGFGIDEAVLAHLVDGLGRERGAANRELEKLALYCAGQGSVTLEDVLAVCSGVGDDRLDSLVDAVFGGALEVADRLLVDLIGGGVDVGRIANALLSHAVRLQEFKLAIVRGQSVDNVIRTARPVVFFGRVPVVIGHLRAWDVFGLLRAGRTMSEAVYRCRREPALADAIVGRAVMSVGRLRPSSV